MGDVNWRSMVAGAKCTTGCTEGVNGNLRPAYVAALDSLSKKVGGTSIPYPVKSNEEIGKA